MKKVWVLLVVSLCFMLFLAGTVKAAEEEVSQKDIEKVVKALKGIKFGLLWYLSYQNGETGDFDNGTGYSQFVGYFRHSQV